MKGCKEFEWASENVYAKGFKGQNGLYPHSRGYKIDLTGNRTLNKQKIDKLKNNKWIDQDTRAIQVMLNVFSVWTNTYYYVEINIEIPYSDQ
jgi:hypothetical protein